jgi:Sugar fermentation stimulation protein RE domain
MTTSPNEAHVAADDFELPSTPHHPFLLELSSDCVQATLLCRPSQRNRSPYVGDIELVDTGRVAICHLPNLDMGGKCVPGVTLWVEPFKDKTTGHAIGANAVNRKYNTPKCEFAARLVRVQDDKFVDARYESVWVGGHPSLGETLAEVLITRHMAQIKAIPGIGVIKSYQKQVTISDHTRADFVLYSSPTISPTPTTPKHRIVEVKTVVDTDYCASWNLPPPNKTKCIFTSNREPYQRAALFPWGSSRQKGPDGESVVSTRAIKHVRELTDLVKRKEYDATILFLVVRGDAETFRPNHEACPSFARYLKEAKDAGVQLLAKRVKWDDTDVGRCYEDKWLDIEFP